MEHFCAVVQACGWNWNQAHIAKRKMKVLDKCAEQDMQLQMQKQTHEKAKAV